MEGEFKERYKDINVTEVITTHDSIGRLLDVQVNGENLNGERVWILLHVHPDVPPTIEANVVTED